MKDLIMLWLPWFIVFALGVMLFLCDMYSHGLQERIDDLNRNERNRIFYDQYDKYCKKCEQFHVSPMNSDEYRVIVKNMIEEEKS